MSDKRKIIIFDTTLRDGEQSPGCSMNIDEKLEVARVLEAMKVDVIEAGFPIASQGDFDAVHAVAEMAKYSTIAGLARCVDKDIIRAGEAVKPAGKSRIHIFCATSEIHRKYKLKRAKDEIIKMSVEGIKLACEFTKDVEFSPEDASRTEWDFLAEVVGAVIDAGATTVNIPDTVGYAIPEQFAKMIGYLVENVPNITDAVISVHCHDDLGLAVANSLSAVRAGAGQVECTMNGIGERAGNAAMEEIVMALRTRADFFNADTGIDACKIFSACRLVSAVTGHTIPRNKSIVGENAFAHESGVHQHGVLAKRECYEIMKPTDVGVPESKLVLGKHSGRHAFRERVKALGYSLDDEQIDLAFEKFKALADKKKQIFDEDLQVIIDGQMQRTAVIWSLAGVQTTAGSNTTPTATVTLRKDEKDYTDAATGDGPVDAVYQAIQRITGTKLKLTDYNIRAVTSGTDAQGEVTIEVEKDDKRFRTQGVSTDIVEASAIAYLSAVNRAESQKNVKQQKSHQP